MSTGLDLVELPEVSLGWQVAHWIETLLCHGPGDVEGEPINLDREFLAAYVHAYQLNTEDGRRKIRRYVLSRAKGRAKSEFAGWTAIAEAFGPVRFHHWAVKGETSWWGYAYEPGEPVGAPVTRPFVRCLATEETQSENTYGNVFFILNSEEARITEEIRGIDSGLTRTFLPNHAGEIRPSTASNAAKDGGKETHAVFDETHLYRLPDLRQMHRTVSRNLRKRKAAQPWALETTTMFSEGEGSIAETTFKAIEQGLYRRGDIVFDHREGPDPDNEFDFDDDDQLKAALQVAYGAADWMPFDDMIGEIRDPESEKSQSIQFFLNRRYSSELDIVPIDQYDRLATDDQIADGDSVTLGFDGSDSQDSTGLIVVRGVDGLTDVLGLWEKPPADHHWRVPRHEVHAAVAAAFDRFRVVRMYCDRRYWETDVDDWKGRYGDKVVFDFPQSDKRISEAARLFATLIAAAIQALDEEIEQLEFANRIAHTGHPDLRRHLLNARRKRLTGRLGQQGGWIPIKKRPSQKIDLVAAAINAHKARGDAIANGELTEHMALDGPLGV